MNHACTVLSLSIKKNLMIIKENVFFVAFRLMEFKCFYFCVLCLSSWTSGAISFFLDSSYWKFFLRKCIILIIQNLKWFFNIQFAHTVYQYSKRIMLWVMDGSLKRSSKKGKFINQWLIMCFFATKTPVIFFKNVPGTWRFSIG